MRTELSQPLLRYKEVDKRFMYFCLRKWWSREIKDSVFEKFTSLAREKIRVLKMIENRHAISLELQSAGWTNDYTPLYVNDAMYHDFVFYSPQVFYRILPDEVVYDIDAENKASAKEQLRALLDYLSPFVDPWVFYSGNRGFHVHFYISVENLPLDKMVFHPDTNRAKLLLYDWIFVNSLVDADRSVVSSPHTIRAPYSLNCKKRPFGYKKPLKELNDLPVFNVKKEFLKKLHTLEANHSATKTLNRPERKYASTDVAEVLKKLEKYQARETAGWISYHCPYHPPDKHPSFVFYKNTKLFVDFHDGRVIKPSELMKDIASGAIKADS